MTINVSFLISNGIVWARWRHFNDFKIYLFGNYSIKWKKNGKNNFTIDQTLNERFEVSLFVNKGK